MIPYIFFLLFIILPITEIIVFIIVGGIIGVIPTLLMIIATAILGSALLRIQGFRIITQIRSEVNANHLPSEELGHGAMILLAGILLLIPGFVTDTLGLLLFIPKVRTWIWHIITHNIITVTTLQSNGMRSKDNRVIDLEDTEWTNKEKTKEHTPWQIK